jgi:AcrR family transcriptional regulator
MKSMATGLSRERIIDAAFRAWGRSFFMRTGLELVAQDLGVTKPAMYRYFRNKDELIHAMEEDFRNCANRYLGQPLAELQHRETARTEDVARTYFQAMFQLFHEKPYHYPFFLRRILGRSLRESAGTPHSTPHNGAGMTGLVATLLNRSQDRTASTAAARYLTMSAVFWMTHHYRKTLGRNPLTDFAFEPEAMDHGTAVQTALIDSAVNHFIRGFAPAVPGQINFESVERISTISPEEVPPPDKVLAAIATVVERYGYARATVTRIARVLGVTRSSLYHYFRNKDEMLSRTMVSSQKQIAGLAALRFRQLETDEERLYALFVILGDYAVLNPASAVVENWVRENNIEVQIPPSHVVEIQKIYTFITDMLVQGNLAGSPEDAFGILQFIGFIVMQEIAVLTVPGQDPQFYRHTIRELFRRFAGGAAPEGVPERPKNLAHTLSGKGETQ